MKCGVYFYVKKWRTFALQALSSRYAHNTLEVYKQGVGLLLQVGSRRP